MPNWSTIQKYEKWTTLEYERPMSDSNAPTPRVLSQIHVCCECGRIYAAGGFKTLEFSSSDSPPEWVKDQYIDQGAWVVHSPTHPCECDCEWFERGTVHEQDTDDHPGYVGEQP